MGGLQIGLSDGKEHHGWKPSTDKWFSTVVWKADNVVDPDGCCLGYGVCSLRSISGVGITVIAVGGAATMFMRDCFLPQ
jgi:hypothetical protein